MEQQPFLRIEDWVIGPAAQVHPTVDPVVNQQLDEILAHQDVPASAYGENQLFLDIRFALGEEVPGREEQHNRLVFALSYQKAQHLHTQISELLDVMRRNDH